MNKEQLEDDKAYIQLFNQNTKLSKRVKELEEDCEYLSHHYGLEAEKNKRYREAIDKTLHKCDLADDTGHDYTDEIRYELRKALEGESK